MKKDTKLNKLKRIYGERIDLQNAYLKELNALNNKYHAYYGLTPTEIFGVMLCTLQEAASRASGTDPGR